MTRENDWPTKSLRKKADVLCAILTKNYGDAVSDRKLKPIDELILTILSQHTNDINMYKAYDSLKENYRTWDDVLVAPPDELGLVIRSSGMYNVKAKRIQATLGEIKKRVGKLDLSLLEDMDDEDAKQWLTSLYGVGPKTAAIVLLFSLGRKLLPVDTHVWRITKRVGLIDAKISREKAHDLLQELIPSQCIPSLNKNLVRHGREICRALNPRCDDCILQNICNYYANPLTGGDL